MKLTRSVGQSASSKTTVIRKSVSGSINLVNGWGRCQIIAAIQYRAEAATARCRYLMEYAARQCAAILHKKAMTMNGRHTKSLINRHFASMLSMGTDS